MIQVEKDGKRIYSEERRSTEMTEIELLIDFHVDGERQGPGSDADTLKALSFIDIVKNKHLNIADIGCGSGAQTMTLAQNLDGKITAIDLFSNFLSRLNKRAISLGLQEKIVTLEKSMEDLPFSDEEYDIIWSEGAIYNIGYSNQFDQGNHLLRQQSFVQTMKDRQDCFHS